MPLDLFATHVRPRGPRPVCPWFTGNDDTIELRQRLQPEPLQSRSRKLHPVRCERHRTTGSPFRTPLFDVSQHRHDWRDSAPACEQDNLLVELFIETELSERPVRLYCQSDSGGAIQEIGNDPLLFYGHLDEIGPQWRRRDGVGARQFLAIHHPVESEKLPGFRAQRPPRRQGNRNVTASGVSRLMSRSTSVVDDWSFFSVNPRASTPAATRPLFHRTRASGCRT
jgi:hypothetical protein